MRCLKRVTPFSWLPCGTSSCTEPANALEGHAGVKQGGVALFCLLHAPFMGPPCPPWGMARQVSINNMW